MGTRAYLPIDMPHDVLGGFQQYDQKTRTGISQLIDRAHAQGRWRASEDILWNPQDLEFMAYWAQKCVDPLTEPMRGSGLKEKLSAYRRTTFDLTPDGFAANKTYRLSAAGDLMRAVHLEESLDRLYRPVADLIFGADYAYANLESSIAPGKLKGFSEFEQGGTPYMNVTRAEFHALTRHMGRTFDVLQLANNHVLDWGEEGVSLAIEALRSDGIDFIGVYESEQASTQPTITTLGDIKIGWVAHTFSVNQKPLPEEKPWIVDITPFYVERDPDTSRIEQQIVAARAAGCDLVLACMHWGAEWEFYPLPGQLTWAHKFAELGADAVIGTHPGVIQPVEIYRPNSDRQKAVPILYSLGNLTPSMGAAYTALSLVANLTLAHGRLGDAACTVITGLELTPVAFMGEEEDGRRNAVCAPLCEIAGCGLDCGTRAYVSEMSGYADLVLGEDWRRAS